MRTCLRTTLALLISAAFLPGQATEEKAVVDTVQKLFTAMEAKDAAAIKATMLAGAQLISVRADGKASVTLAEKFAEGMGAAEELLVERMWEPKVLVQNNIATLWAPYDFHRSGKLTHCGIDAVSLLKVEGEWKIASITYNVQQQGCPNK